MIDRAERGRRKSDSSPDTNTYWTELGFLPARAELLVTKASTDQVLANGRCVFAGMTVRETAAAALVYEIYDGTDATGVPITENSIGASGITNTLPQFPGVLCERGIFFHVVSGNGVLRGAVYIKRHGR